MLTGEGIGSFGYGRTDFEYDFGSIVTVRTISVDYHLFANTNGRWRISASDDGYNYSDYSIYFQPNEDATFDSVICRYLKFDLELYSGLSASNEEPYENIPTGGIPLITDINIYYAPRKIDYIFINPVYNGDEVDQVVIAINSNSTHLDNKLINSGIATGQWTHHWEDFHNDAQPPIEESGKSVIPRRRGIVEEQRIEPLISVDGYVFEATNGPWGSESTVLVTNIPEGLSTVSVVNSSIYTVVPREGLIIFRENRNRSGQHFINIYNQDSFRISAQIINNDDDNTEIYGIAHMYNEPE